MGVGTLKGAAAVQHRFWRRLKDVNHSRMDHTRIFVLYRGALVT